MQRNLSSFADARIARACLDDSFSSHGCILACCADLVFLGCYRRKDYWRAKYELLHVVRTHMGANDQRCAFASYIMLIWACSALCLSTDYPNSALPVSV